MGTYSSIDIRLLGQKLSLKTQADPDLAREVIELVSRKLQEVETRVKSPAPHVIALQALLDLGEEFILAKRRMEEHQASIHERSSELKNLLETEWK